MTEDALEQMLKLCRRIYREKQPRKLTALILDLNELIRRKVDELKNDQRQGEPRPNDEPKKSRAIH
jgi:hypothetical protein